jgi:hypothetical protein
MRLSRRVAQLFAHPLAPYAWALAMQLVFSGYVKDDAFIEYRYATNCARGHGLVFNVGDPPVEGFTSFLWTVALVLPARLHLPLLLWCKFIGVAALCTTIALVARWVRLRGGDESAAQLGRWITATNASLVVWAQSGMEPVVVACLPLAAVYRLEQRRHWAAMLLFAAAACVRPECHVLLGLGAVVVLRRRDARPVALALLLVGGIHLWRWRYFGSLVPNTALVKTGQLVWWAGLRALGELALTSLAAVVIGCALVEAGRRRDDVALACAAAIVIFCAYLFRIGRDEMALMRLFLPVWPLALGLATPLLARAWSLGPLRLAPLCVCGFGVAFTASRLHTIHYRRLGEQSHAVLAARMKERARPGELVVFQDLGQTPWAAMELRFVDPIGLVDATIARVRWAERRSPFLGTPSGTAQAKIRDHLFALDPKLIAFVAYLPDDQGTEARRQMAASRAPADLERLFGWWIDANPYHVGLHADPRFGRYRLVDVVRRLDSYWFVLYERS